MENTKYYLHDDGVTGYKFVEDEGVFMRKDGEEKQIHGGTEEMGKANDSTRFDGKEITEEEYLKL